MTNEQQQQQQQWKSNNQSQQRSYKPPQPNTAAFVPPSDSIGPGSASPSTPSMSSLAEQFQQFLATQLHAMSTSSLRSKPSLRSFANWVSLFFSQVSNTDPVIAVLDGERGGDYRRELLPSYKAHRRQFLRDSNPSRNLPLDYVGRSFQVIKDVLQNCNVPVIKIVGHEADDVVATLVAQVLQKGYKAVIASPDKDFKQLISHDVQLVMPLSDLERWSFYTIRHYIAQYNCDPHSDLSLKMLLQAAASINSWPRLHHHQRSSSGHLNVKLHNFTQKANFQTCREPRLRTSWAGHVPNCSRILNIQEELSEPDSDGDSSGQATTSESTGSDNDSASQSPKPSGDSGIPEFPNKNMNRTIAVVSTMAAVALFASSRLDFGVSLKDLSAVALPYEQALANGKPTVVEFYADWCEVCRELAPDVYKVEQQFKDRVNFVMLNVDNTKWEQELDEFGVEGIPHFAFLDDKGNEEGNIVGRLPRQYLFENVDALARGETAVPHARIVGQYTSTESRKVHQVVNPRSHG